MQDVIIIGGGPAGYAAGLYSTRGGLSTLILEKGVTGGQMSTSSRIDNYPGAEPGVEGYVLAERMRKQAEQFGAVTKTASVSAIDLKSNPKQVTLESGEVLEAKSLILAMGMSPKKLGVVGEERFRGKGVSYCATCDGMFFRGKDVVIVGGGNTAVEDALLLAKTSRKVYLVHRRNRFRASPIYVNLLETTDNIEVIFDDTVTEIRGERLVQSVLLQSGREIPCSGVFVAVGSGPNTDMVADTLELDENGYIVADETTVTSIPGVFAAGDLRKKVLHQIITAVSDGACAGVMARKYLMEKG